MALEPKRDQPVRLPNPSAQPFVVALKTARFYAVVLFWVAMVCVLAHATTFVLTEWMGLYDFPSAAAPAVQEPVEPKPPADAPKDAPPAGTSWLDLLEKSAVAAPARSAPGELFPSVPFEGETKKPATPGDSSKPLKTPVVEPKDAPKSTPAGTSAEPPVTVTPTESATEGKVVGQPEARPKEPVPLTPAERRQKVQQYRQVTDEVLRPARIVGVLASVLLGLTVFLYLQIALLGRLSGIRQLTNALFFLLLFLVTILPWENVFEGFRGASSLYDFGQLLESHTSRLRGMLEGTWPQVLYFGRFFVMPLVSAALLAWSGIQFAAGYAESVLANE
jgi:hypothetical protein